MCGTSEASPLLEGLVVDAAALAHRPLGIADVTAGCATALGVGGWCGSSGYDRATGLGTIGNTVAFIRALAAGVDR